jgi:signal transduction histidine kinase
LFDAAAEEKRTHLVAAADQRVVVAGDRDLLFDALSNLVDNAIKHGHGAGEVKVTVARNDDGASISVSDDGPGIPADQFQHVFKRFYRLERSRHTPGNGLGLSLVSAVARLHGARIELDDNAPGLRFRLLFASAAGSDAANEPPADGDATSPRA